MPSFIDEISPREYGEDRLVLSLRDPNAALAAFTPILIAVDYDRTLPDGVSLPLEFTVTAPTAGNSTRLVFRHFKPTALAFTPKEGGQHLVRLAECYHARWWGALVLEIAGDRLRAT